MNVGAVRGRASSWWGWRVQRPCDACGVAYEAQTVRSRFCSKKCRSRWGRWFRPPAVVHAPSGEPAPVGQVRAATLASSSASTGSVRRSARWSWPAGRIDVGGDTAAGLASLAGRWMETLGRATDGAPQVADPLDELRRLRQRRIGAGA